MRVTRKFTLLALLALAATGLAAPISFAQTEPLAHNQAPRLIVQQEVHAGTDLNCPVVTPTPAPNPGPLSTSGGCRMHVAGANIAQSEHLTAGGTEVLVSNCTVEFHMRLDADGEGYASHQEFTGDPATCTKKPCGQVTPPITEGRAFSVYLQETEPAPRERIVFLFCLENRDGSGAASHCEATLTVSEPTRHRYQFVAVDASGHGAVFPHCEWNGTLDTEAALEASCEHQNEQSIEIRHS
jgi:hypothetical protein